MTKGLTYHRVLFIMRRFEPRKEGQSPRDVEKRMFYKRPADGHSLEGKKNLAWQKQQK